MAFFKKGELKLLWPFYFEFLFARAISFVAPFLIVYFTDIGFNPAKIGIIMAVTSAFSLIFEIPTGAIADLYGRKFSVLLGYFLEGACYLLLFFFTSYSAILLISAMLGIAITLSSGAKDAWTTDLIKSKTLLASFFAKSAIFMSASMVLAGLIGGLLVRLYGLSIIFPAATISFILSILVLLPAKENYKRRKIHIKKSFLELKKQALASIKYSSKHKTLSYFLLATGIMSIVFILAGNLSWTPLLLGKGLPKDSFGYLWSAMALVTVLASLTSNKFLKKNKEKKFMLIALTLFTISTIFVLILRSLWPLVGLLMIIIFFLDLQWPASRVYFHKFIPKRLRATIGSIESMVVALGGIIAPILTGYLVDLIGPANTIFVAGMLMIVPITLIKKS